VNIQLIRDTKVVTEDCNL